VQNGIKKSIGLKFSKMVYEFFLNRYDNLN